MTQEEILKAITTDLGGQMSPQDASDFIVLTKKQNGFLSEISTVEMQSSSYNIHLLDVAARNIQAPGEATAPNGTGTASFPKRTLNYKEGVVPFDISYSFLEENITKEQADKKLQEAFATSFGNDLLDMAINGDESLPDTTADNKFLRQNNGWIKLFKAEDSGVHAVSLAECATMKEKFAKVLATMPDKWKGDLNKLVFLVNPTDYETYCDEIGAIAADAGINVLLNAPEIKAKGVAIRRIAYMPKGTIILTMAKNLYVGIGRDMRTEKQVQSRKRLIEYTITSKFDFEFAAGDMIVYGYPEADAPAAPAEG